MTKGIAKFLRMPSSGRDQTAGSRILRGRHAALRASLDRVIGELPYTVNRKLVQVFDNGNIPTTAPKTYFTHPIIINGDETEGATGVLSVDNDTVIPVVVLWEPAQAGDNLIAYSVGSRWVAEHVGGGNCTCTLEVCVQSCSLAQLPGAIVTIRDLNNNVLGSCEAGSNGCCLFEWSVDCPCCEAAPESTGHCTGCPETVRITVTRDGYYEYDRVKTINCGDSITIQLRPTTLDWTFSLHFAGCCPSAIPGISVTLDGVTKETDDLGLVKFTITEPGTYTWTATKDRWATATGEVTVFYCEQINSITFVIMDPADGYACGPTQYEWVDGICVANSVLIDPVPTTLSLSDSEFGNTTLTYDSANNWWLGTISASWSSEADNGNPPGVCPDTNFTITYKLYPCGTAGKGIQACYLTFRCATCPGPIPNAFEMPADSAQTCAGGGPIVTGTGASICIDACDVNCSTTAMNPTIPLNYTFTWGLAPCGANTTIWPNGVTITVTE